MKIEIIAILISCASILIASLSLGWNIYRDIMLKAKLKVKFGVALITHPTYNEPLERLIISATNFGPGKITCTMIFIKSFSLWKKITKKTELALLIHDYTDPLSENLPCELDIGDGKNFMLKFDKDCFLSESCTHIGIQDSFGRIHWAPRKHVKEAQKSYLEKFNNQQKS